MNVEDDCFILLAAFVFLLIWGFPLMSKMNDYNILDDVHTDSDGNDDGYDEFLFQSVQRYNTLQMFNLENIPSHVFQLDNASICVASKTTTNSSELLKLKLPVKLTLPPEEEGRSKGNDFKILSGIYTHNPIYKIGKLGSDSLVLTSEINRNGLQIYSLADFSLGNKNKVQKLDFMNWVSPDFTKRPKMPHLICSKSCHHPLVQVDISMNKKFKEIKHPFFTFSEFPVQQSKEIDSPILNNITCIALNENLIAVLSTHSGQVFLHDLRTDDTFTSLPGVGEGLTSEVWTLSDCNCAEGSPDYFGILSNTTSFCIYDIRTNQVMFHRRTKNLPVENHRNMKLKFSGTERKFSISGMSSGIEIFRFIENNFEHIFTHNGHCPNKKSFVFVTDHTWLQCGSKEYIVSVCDNKTLNCWN